MMVVRQLPAPPITCVRVMTTGETAESRKPWLRSISASSIVSRLNVCAPWLTPPCIAEPGVITSMLVPSPWICRSICRCAPEPIATITFTAPTPMMMPSMVSSVRILFLTMLCAATLTSVFALMRHLPFPPRGSRARRPRRRAGRAPARRG